MWFHSFLFLFGLVFYSIFLILLVLSFVSLAFSFHDQAKGNKRRKRIAEQGFDPRGDGPSTLPLRHTGLSFLDECPI